jgi:hypothetical protein
MIRTDVAACLAWVALAAFVIYRGYANPDPFDYITTLAAWWGGVVSVSVITVIQRHIDARRDLKPN